MPIFWEIASSLTSNEATKLYRVHLKETAHVFRTFSLEDMDIMDEDALNCCRRLCRRRKKLVYFSMGFSKYLKTG